jgi:hypothetical protein
MADERENLKHDSVGAWAKRLYFASRAVMDSVLRPYGWAAWMDHGFAASASSLRFQLCIKLRNKESYNHCPRPGFVRQNLRIYLHTRVSKESERCAEDWHQV